MHSVTKQNTVPYITDIVCTDVLFYWAHSEVSILN